VVVVASFATACFVLRNSNAQVLTRVRFLDMTGATCLDDSIHDSSSVRCVSIRICCLLFAYSSRRLVSQQHTHALPLLSSSKAPCHANSITRNPSWCRQQQSICMATNETRALPPSRPLSSRLSGSFLHPLMHGSALLQDRDITVLQVCICITIVSECLFFVLF
jgi:hypothetical protein